MREELNKAAEEYYFSPAVSWDDNEERIKAAFLAGAEWMAKHQKTKPTAKHIAARLCESWGGRIEILHLATEPYEHYYDDGGEEVPYSAIEKWQEVTI